MSVSIQPPPIKEGMISQFGNLSQVWIKWFISMFKAQIDVSDMEIKNVLTSEPVDSSKELGELGLKDALVSEQVYYDVRLSEDETRSLLEQEGKSYDKEVSSNELIALLEQTSPDSTWETRIKALETGSQWPVGSIFIAVVSTNPGTLLGFGTWTAFGTGRFLVGIDSGDTDFDTVEEEGGAKTHKHSVDVGSTASGAPSATTTVDNDLALSTVAVASDAHTHDVNPAAVDSATVSNVSPYIVVYMWKRTA